VKATPSRGIVDTSMGSDPRLALKEPAASSDIHQLDQVVLTVHHYKAVVRLKPHLGYTALANCLIPPCSDLDALSLCKLNFGEVEDVSKTKKYFFCKHFKIISDII